MLASGLGLLLAQRLQAQGFAGLGQGGTGFALPDPGYRLRFPRDHAAHPGFRIEWWYLTANLTDPQGRDWGAQWTLFRSALDPEEPRAQAWMGHAALASPEGHLSAERLARPGQAGVRLTEAPTRLEARIDEWRLTGDPETRMRVSAGGSDFAFDLGLTATGPLVLQGDAGYSVKSPGGQASHYYSQPFLKAAGEVQTGGGALPVTGIAWLDREWSSEPLAADQSGWDWFSLSLDSGAKLMGFVLRGASRFTAATWIAPDGRATPLPDGAFRAEPLDWAKVAGHRLPLRWRVRLADPRPEVPALDLEVRAIRPDAWMPMLFPYWEGPVRVSGSAGGIGYLEMTGYE
ncbi:iron ABC transporter permease [Frigidibacter sp. SLM-1]|nr:lipocalin-like domain-containing protein [Frigidibacter sp. ROC022]MCR8725050.1 iron ABC transporter permease [Frigidibacter sp. ROC022]